MKTIIAQGYQKEKIFHDLSQTRNGVVENIQVLSLENLLDEDIDEPLVLLLQLSQLLKDKTDDFPIFASMFHFPAFLKEILTFTKTCILWSIEPSMLVSDNPNEEELKGIVTLAYTLDFKEKEMVQTNITKMEELKGQEITLYPSFYSDLYHYALFEQLKQNFPMMEVRKNNPYSQLRYALNTRQEIEAIAQNICNSGRTSNIVLASYDNQLPVVKQIFQRYGIPYSCVKDSPYCHISTIFVALLSFAYKQDRDTFLATLKYNCYAKECPFDVYDYLQQRMVDSSLPEPIATTVQNSALNNDGKYYEIVEKKLQNFMKEIHEDYELLKSSKTPQEILENAYTVLQKNPYLRDQNELKVAMKIRSTIQKIYSLIQMDDLPFLVSLFDGLSLNQSDYNNDFCIITDLTHPVTARANTYVIGCSGANYPGFPACKGLFDENYVQKIKEYPSLAKRHQTYMDQLQWISNSATEDIFYSYPTNDYEGREIQLAYEIEAQFPPRSAALWDLDTYADPKSEEHHLTEQTAKQLFGKEGKIVGSISTIERWFQCPYSYFIQSGLKIRKRQLTNNDAASIGTIQHAIMENAVKDHQKDYATISKEEIETILDPYFETLKLLYPNDTELFIITRQRMLTGIQTSLSFLKDMEMHTSFQPTQTEQRFQEYEIVDNVFLRGIIDRIDECNHLFRIVDYKSSTHSLSEGKIKAGLQLQLLSYLMVGTSLMQKTPTGAYYFSLKNENNTIPAAKVSRSVSEETEFNEDTYFAIAQKSQRLDGWTFEDRQVELDDNSEHIKSLKKQKDYEVIQECIQELYCYFRDHLFDGDIRLQPVENACMFCDYASVCRFQGQVIKPQPLVMKDIKFDKGKE